MMPDVKGPERTLKESKSIAFYYSLLALFLVFGLVLVCL